MTEGKSIKGGKVRVLLDPTGTGNYTAPCGFTSKSVAINKGGEDVALPDCDDPDALSWLGRDAVSLTMSIGGPGVLYEESVETWLDAVESGDSIATKVEWEFPSKTITWTGLMQVETFSAEAPDKRRVTTEVAMRSDGKMTRVVS